MVTRLSGLRGIGTLTAFGLATEVGDWQRFTGATIGAYLGLVPTEASSGAQRVQGSITKTGNTHARRLLIEAAWHHRKPFKVTSKALRARRTKPHPACEPAPSWPTGACTTAGTPWTAAANGPPSPRWPSPGSWPDGAGAWLSWTTDSAAPPHRPLAGQRTGHA